MPHNPEDNPQFNERRSIFALSDRYDHGEFDVLFLGDSQFHKALWNEFLPTLKVINRGIGSDSTQGMLRRLDEYKNYKPKKVVFAASANDFSYKFEQAESIDNCKKIFEKIHEYYPQADVVMLSIIPHFSDQYRELGSDLSKALKDACAEWHEKFVDINTIMLDAMANATDGGESLFVYDKGHLSGKGYAILLDALKDFLGC